MSDTGLGRGAKGPGKKRTLRARLETALFVAMVVILAAFTWWDYRSERNVHLNEKRLALEGEAEAMLVAVLDLKGNPQAIQRHIDKVCARMQETSSPGHHIAVRLGEQTFQALVRGRQSERMYEAMQTAAGDPAGVARGDGRTIVVGVARSGDGRTIVVGVARSGDAGAFVAEHIVDIQRWMRAQVLRRMLSILLLGLTIGVVVKLLVRRLVTNPLAGMVEGVRKVKGGELGARVPSEGALELGFLADEFNAMSTALADVELRRRRQMDKARRIQEHLLPTPPSGLGLSIAYVYEPADSVAGDYFDIRRGKGGTVIVCVADVSGHGVPAALLAAMLKTMFASACEGSSEPGRILADINDALAMVTLDEDFASMIVCVADPSASRLRYASAGHELAYLLGQDREPQIMAATGPPLGIQSDARWQEIALRANPGDRCVMMTDGLAELRSARGELLGRERLKDLLAQHMSAPLDDMCRRVVDDARAHLGTEQQEDDITIVAVQL